MMNLWTACQLGQRSRQLFMKHQSSQLPCRKRLVAQRQPPALPRRSQGAGTMGVVVSSRGGHQETQGVEVPELVQWGQTERCRHADLQLLLVAQQGKRYT